MAIGVSQMSQLSQLSQSGRHRNDAPTTP